MVKNNVIIFSKFLDDSLSSVKKDVLKCINHRIAFGEESLEEIFDFQPIDVLNTDHLKNQMDFLFKRLSGGDKYVVIIGSAIGFLKLPPTVLGEWKFYNSPQSSFHYTSIPSSVFNNKRQTIEDESRREARLKSSKMLHDLCAAHYYRLDGIMEFYGIS